MATERTRRAQRALTGAIVFCFVFMGVEVYFGIKAHSLAIITDAMHLFTDVAALCLALGATFASSWAGSKRLSFGWHRAEVVGAMGSVFLVWALAGFITVEGVTRLVAMIKCAKHSEGANVTCEGVEGRVMFIVGCAGFCVNIIVAGILMVGGHGHSHGGLAGGANTCTGHGHGNHADAHHDDDHGHAHARAHAPTAARTACDTAAAHSHDCHEHAHDHGHSHGGHGPDAHHQCASDEASPLLRPSSARPSSGGGGCGGHGDHGHGHGGDDHGVAVHLDDDHSDHGHAHGGDGGNMNVRGAMIHAIGDCVQSLGVVGSAAIIWGFNGPDADARSWFNIADPICSLVFATITLYTTRYLTRDVFYVLMEGTPDDVSHDKLLERLCDVPNVQMVEHLHVWALTPTIKNLTAQIVAPRLEAHPQVLRDCKAIVRAAGVWHSTLQISVEAEDNTGAGEEMSPLCVGGSKPRFGVPPPAAAAPRA